MAPLPISRTSSGTADPHKLQFCSGFFDMNNDKWPDIYTAHDKLKINTMFRNEGNGLFSDIGIPAGTALSMNAMCVTVGDYNNDGLQDIYVTNTPIGNALLKNNGDDTFDEVAASTGTGFYSTGWASQFIDADNDGDQDLYVSGSYIGTTYPSSTFYENEGDGTFSEPDAGFVGDTVSSYSNALGDFNDDGYLDIIVVNTGSFDSQLWQNAGGDNNWIKVKLEGVYSNRDAIGSLIEVFVNGQRQIRYTHCGIGFMGQNSATETIGIGSSMQADSIYITWPTGHIDRLFDIPAGSRLDVLEGSTTNGMIDVDPDITLVGVPIDTTTSTHSPAVSESILIAPNPALSFTQIQLENELMKTIEVFDTHGRKHFFERFSSPVFVHELKVNNWPAGIYFVRVLDSSGRTYIKPLSITK